MSDKNLYRLSNHTAVEPLVNSWAVWSDRISPAPASLHLLNYQVKVISSYLQNPEIHVKTCQNQKLVGGPFVDIPAERAGEVKELLDKTMVEQGKNIEFARAINSFYSFLLKEAKGQSLEPFYTEVPDELRGYVELVYDYNNNPILRFIESLLYDSPYYNSSLQSLRIFQQARDDSRKFFLSTPRLSEKDQVDWKVNFDSPEIDELFKLESKPEPLGYIRELFGLTPADDAALLGLLTEEDAPPFYKSNKAGVQIRYFGHACVLVDCDGVSILTDPWIGVLPQNKGLDRLSYWDLPEKIDYVLITHGHHDHFVLESLLRLRNRIECLVVPRTFGMFHADTSLKLLARRVGFKSVIELDSMESIKLPNGEIISVPFLGEHADLPHGKTGYVVRAGDQSILFAADSNCLDVQLYRNIRKAVGPIQTVFLGMECVGAPLSWLYGALLPNRPESGYDKSRRTKGCNSKAALDLLNAVGGNRVYIYAMGSEPWLQYSMGLGPMEDSPQIRESNLVLSKAREAGFIDAQRPFGKLEIDMNSGSN